MSVPRAVGRRVTEGMLAFCAICIWMYDYHLFFSSTPGATELNPGVLMDQSLATVAYPWHGATLPRIPWSPFPAPDEIAAETESAEFEIPNWILLGTYTDSERKGALLRDVDSGQSQLVLLSETWAGITLQDVGVGWVECRQYDNRWRLTISSITAIEK